MRDQTLLSLPIRYRVVVDRVSGGGVTTSIGDGGMWIKKMAREGNEFLVVLDENTPE